MKVTLTLTLEEILALPGEAALKLIERAGPAQVPPLAAYDLEAKGKARWPVLNGLRHLCRDFPKS